MLLPSGTALYMYDLEKRTLTQISQEHDASAKLHCKLSPCNDGLDDLMVAYVSNNDIYVQLAKSDATPQRLTFAAGTKFLKNAIVSYIF